METEHGSDAMGARHLEDMLLLNLTMPLHTRQKMWTEVGVEQQYYGTSLGQNFGRQPYH